MPELPREDRIRAKAFEIWLSQDMPHGRDLDHWIAAEALVAEEETALEIRLGDGAPVHLVDRAASFGQHADTAREVRPGEGAAVEPVMHQQGIGG